MREKLPSVLRPFAPMASSIFGGVTSLRNWTFDQGWRVGEPPVPVISVGNLSVGGSGKTPLVMWLVERLRESGFCPAIAMRGYGSRTHGHSDEEAEYFERLGAETPIIAQPNRMKGLRSRCESDSAIDCCVLDDGFQHRMVGRILDLVTIDATQNTLHDRLLPMGYLRELPLSLKRADGVIVTRAGSFDAELSARIEAISGAAPLAWVNHVWKSLVRHDVSGEQKCDPEQLKAMRVVTALGVGNPASVCQQVKNYGAEIVENIPLADHQAFDASLVGKLNAACQGAEALLVTAKDWVKLRHVVDLALFPVPILVPQLRMEFLRGGEFLEARAVETVRLNIA